MTAAPMPFTARAKRAGRQTSGWLHLWVGLIIGLPAALLGVTGSVMMAVRPTPVSVEAAAAAPNIDAVLTAAQATVEGGALPSQYESPAMFGRPASVRFSVPRSDANPRGLKQVLVDPVSLAIIPQEAPSGPWVRIVHDLHGSFMAGHQGRMWVGIAGAAMVGLGFTGLVLWWPKRGKWAAAFTVSGRGGALRVLRELHGAAGIWGLVVFLIVSATGIVLAFPPGGGPPGARPRGDNDAPAVLHADAATAVALEGRPNNLLRAITFPRVAGEPYQLTLDEIGGDRGGPAVSVTVDGNAERVVTVRDPAAGPWFVRVFMWTRSLHVGTGMGWGWWIPVFLSGFLPLLFSISGITMWVLKRRNRARAKAGDAEVVATA